MFFLCVEITVLLYFSSFKSCGESYGNNDQGKGKDDTMYQINYYSISTPKWKHWQSPLYWNPTNVEHSTGIESVSNAPIERRVEIIVYKDNNETTQKTLSTSLHLH